MKNSVISNIKNDEKNYYVFYPFNDGIGDFIIVGGLCSSYSRIIKKHIFYVCHEDFKRFFLSFQNVTFIYVTNEEYEELKKKCENRELDSTKNFLYGWFRSTQSESQIGSVELTFADEFKKYVFGLPIETEVVKPSIWGLTLGEIEELNAKYTLNRRGTIVLVPHGNSATKELSRKLIEIGFWDEVVRLLKEKFNCVIYTNTYGEEKPINNTEAMITSGKELAYLCKNTVGFIGIRCGLLDLVTQLGGFVICLSDIYLYHYDLGRMFGQEVKTIYYFKNLILNILNRACKIDEEMDLLRKCGFDLKFVQNEEGSDLIICMELEEAKNIIHNLIQKRILQLQLEQNS
ncbi:hypothetical protein SAMN06296386_11048 [Lachnospiraceae bacterium]|nr:hypothetical protein SAMN06296386_11048 [Lachnospiraceae bacterium]